MVRPADQHIGAESGSHRRFGRGPGIGPGQHAGKAIGVGENAPHHGTAGSETDIDSDPGHGTGIGFGRTVIRLKIAIDVALRGHDQTDTGRNRTRQSPDLHAPRLRVRRNRYTHRQCCRTDKCGRKTSKRHLLAPSHGPTRAHTIILGENAARVSPGFCVGNQKKPNDSQPLPAEKLPFARLLGMSMICTEPSPWQATKSSSPRNAMSIGCEPTLIALCWRNDGSIRLTVSLLRLVTASRLLSGA